MNMLEALTIVRNCALVSQQSHTRQGKAALSVIDRKLQSLMRKAAWRNGGGAEPIHMGDPNFKYDVPDTHPDKTLLDWLIAHSAYVSHSRDGECCNVWFRYDPEDDSADSVPVEGYPQKCYTDAREAIRAAMAHKR